MTKSDFFFYYGKIWNGKKHPFANVKFDMENFLPFEVPLAIFFVRAKKRISTFREGIQLFCPNLRLLKSNFCLPMSGNLQTVARVRCGQRSISNSGHFSLQIAVSEEYNCHTFLLISKDVKLSTKNMIVLKVRYPEHILQYNCWHYQLGIIGSIKVVPF